MQTVFWIGRIWIPLNDEPVNIVLFSYVSLCPLIHTENSNERINPPGLSVSKAPQGVKWEHVTKSLTTVSTINNCELHQEWRILSGYISSTMSQALRLQSLRIEWNFFPLNVSLMTPHRSGFQVLILSFLSVRTSCHMQIRRSCRSFHIPSKSGKVAKALLIPTFWLFSFMDP